MIMGTPSRSADSKKGIVSYDHSRLIYNRNNYYAAPWAKYCDLRPLDEQSVVSSHPWRTPAHREGQRFMDHFRVTHDVFAEICNTMFPVFNSSNQSSRKYGRYGEHLFDALGRPGVPFELLVLMVLHRLAAGLAFGHMYHQTLISNAVMSVFFKEFTACFVLHYKTDYIRLPNEGPELDACMRPFATTGLTGGFGKFRSSERFWLATVSYVQQ